MVPLLLTVMPFEDVIKMLFKVVLQLFMGTLTLTNFQAIGRRFVGSVESIEAMIAAFAPKRIQEKKCQHRFGANPV